MDPAGPEDVWGADFTGVDADEVGCGHGDGGIGVFHMTGLNGAIAAMDRKHPYSPIRTREVKLDRCLHVAGHLRPESIWKDFHGIFNRWHFSFRAGRLVSNHLIHFCSTKFLRLEAERNQGLRPG